MQYLHRQSRRIGMQTQDTSEINSMKCTQEAKSDKVKPKLLGSTTGDSTSVKHRYVKGALRQTALSERRIKSCRLRGISESK